MGLNPSISFSLRDDDFVVGILTIEKSMEDTVAELITDVLAGNYSRMEEYRNVLLGKVHTEEELAKIRDKYDMLKEDLAYFKSIGATSHRGRLSQFMDRAHNHMQYYCVGGKSWLEHFYDFEKHVSIIYNWAKTDGLIPDDRLQEFKDKYEHTFATSAPKQEVQKLATQMLEDALRDGDVNKRTEAMSLLAAEAGMPKAGIMLLEQQMRMSIDMEQKVIAATENTVEITTDLILEWINKVPVIKDDAQKAEAAKNLYTALYDIADRCDIKLLEGIKAFRVTLGEIEVPYTVLYDNLLVLREVFLEEGNKWKIKNANEVWTESQISALCLEDKVVEEKEVPAEEEVKAEPEPEKDVDIKLTTSEITRILKGCDNKADAEAAKKAVEDFVKYILGIMTSRGISFTNSIEEALSTYLSGGADIGVVCQTITYKLNISSAMWELYFEGVPVISSKELKEMTGLSKK